jgi:CRP-like cAMP-binding protein
MKWFPPQRNGLRNLVLNRLPDSDIKRLSRIASNEEIDARFVLYDVNKKIGRLYFPEDGVGSIVTVLEDGKQIEVATVGFEGMLGLPVLFGATSSTAKAFWQVPGRALVLKADVLDKEKKNGSRLIERLHLYTQAFFTQLAQSVTCNRVHSIEQRCARWLLMTHDRVEGDEFLLTQDFLSQMLGVRRTGVTEVAGRFQKAGLIDYARGCMTVYDRKGLEKVSCECYAIVQNEFKRLMQ